MLPDEFTVYLGTTSEGEPSVALAAQTTTVMVVPNHSPASVARAVDVMLQKLALTTDTREAITTCDIYPGAPSE